MWKSRQSGFCAQLASGVPTLLPAQDLVRSRMEQKRRRTSVTDGLRRVVDLRGLSYATLRKVVSAIKGEAVSKNDITVIARGRYEKVSHTLRLPAVDGGVVAIPVCHPLELLSLLIRDNEYVRTWVEGAWRALPSNRGCPWRLLIGWGEFFPGNKQAIRNDRKQWSPVFLSSSWPTTCTRTQRGSHPWRSDPACCRQCVVGGRPCCVHS